MKLKWTEDTTNAVVFCWRSAQRESSYTYTYSLTHLLTTVSKRVPKPNQNHVFLFLNHLSQLKLLIFVFKLRLILFCLRHSKHWFSINQNADLRHSPGVLVYLNEVTEITVFRCILCFVDTLTLTRFAFFGSPFGWGKNWKNRKDVCN